MSEIYLTKIERKTIFTKSLIFVLIVFIISDLTVTGPVYFNFIPWMYLLGVVGSIKKIDSVLMSVIGTFTVFVSSLIVQGGMNIQCIISTVITLVTLALGIVTGKFIYEFVLEHRLVKYIRRSKKVIYVVLMIAMALASYAMVALNSGDIVTYLKSRSNLEKYIQKTYDIQDFKITKSTYVKNVAGKYTHTVEIEGQKVYFVPISKDVFKDTNKDARLISMQRDLELEITEKIQNVQSKYTLISDATISFDLEYSNVLIAPDTVVMNVKCNKVSEDEQEQLYEQISNCIKELQTVKVADKVVIAIGNQTLQLANVDIQNLTAEYIKGGFDIQEISQ